jgi:hypothetical protein
MVCANESLYKFYAIFPPYLLHSLAPGLPDGFKPKSQFRYILGFGMDNVGVFYCQLVHFMAIWYIL